MRLSNQPCAKCGTDTLHNGPACSVCGTVVEIRGVLLDRRREAELAALEEKGMTRFGAFRTVVVRNALKPRPKRVYRAPIAPIHNVNLRKGKERTKC